MKTALIVREAVAADLPRSRSMRISIPPTRCCRLIRRPSNCKIWAAMPGAVF
jgi:hypothetical protein